MKARIIILLFLFTITVSSQTDWKEIEIEISLLKRNKEITLEEWYLRKKTDAGSIFKIFSAWYKSEDTIKTVSDNRSIKLLFPTEYQIESENGNKYAKMILENHTSEPIEIQRIDATIGRMKEYFFINNNWIQGRENSMSTCGNSYGKQLINPKHRIYFELSNEPLTNGNMKVKYKVIIEINEKEIESNVIEVSLYENQLKRLVETK